jgi:hypothetical protein
MKCITNHAMRHNSLYICRPFQQLTFPPHICRTVTKTLVRFLLELSTATRNVNAFVFSLSKAEVVKFT